MATSKAATLAAHAAAEDPARARREVLTRFMAQHGLKSTSQRDLIMDVFFATNSHVAIGDLHQTLLKRNPKIGYATVYRTLKMLTECGLAVERHFGDGAARFEPNDLDHHHDHLICRGCGAIQEFHDEQIEQLQHDLARARGFRLDSHRHELYGLCALCQKSQGRKRR